MSQWIITVEHNTYRESAYRPWVEDGEECEDSSDEESTTYPLSHAQNDTKRDKYPPRWHHCHKAMQM